MRRRPQRITPLLVVATLLIFVQPSIWRGVRGEVGSKEERQRGGRRSKENGGGKELLERRDNKRTEATKHTAQQPTAPTNNVSNQTQRAAADGGGGGRSAANSTNSTNTTASTNATAAKAQEAAAKKKAGIVADDDGGKISLEAVIDPPGGDQKAEKMGHRGGRLFNGPILGGRFDDDGPDEPETAAYQDDYYADTDPAMDVGHKYDSHYTYDDTHPMLPDHHTSHKKIYSTTEMDAYYPDEHKDGFDDYGYDHKMDHHTEWVEVPGKHHKGKEHVYEVHPSPVRKTPPPPPPIPEATPPQEKPTKKPKPSGSEEILEQAQPACCVDAEIRQYNCPFACCTVKDGHFADKDVWDCGRIPNELDAAFVRHVIRLTDQVPQSFKTDSQQVDITVRALHVINSQDPSLTENGTKPQVGFLRAGLPSGDLCGPADGEGEGNGRSPPPVCPEQLSAMQKAFARLLPPDSPTATPTQLCKAFLGGSSFKQTDFGLASTVFLNIQPAPTSNGTTPTGMAGMAASAELAMMAHASPSDVTGNDGGHNSTDASKDRSTNTSDASSKRELAVVLDGDKAISMAGVHVGHSKQYTKKKILPVRDKQIGERKIRTTRRDPPKPRVPEGAPEPADDEPPDEPSPKPTPAAEEDVLSDVIGEGEPEGPSVLVVELGAALIFFGSVATVVEGPVSNQGVLYMDEALDRPGCVTQLGPSPCRVPSLSAYGSIIATEPIRALWLQIGVGALSPPTREVWEGVVEWGNDLPKNQFSQISFFGDSVVQTIRPGTAFSFRRISFPFSDTNSTSVAVPSGGQSAGLVIYVDVFDTDGFVGCCEDVFVDAVAQFDVSGVPLRLARYHNLQKDIGERIGPAISEQVVIRGDVIVTDQSFAGLPATIPSSRVRLTNEERPQMIGGPNRDILYFQCRQTCTITQQAFANTGGGQSAFVEIALDLPRDRVVLA
ncbi:unnamed protein product [Vitrella brassicaformis CCMP3155]|uniref:Tectonic domain-containing protein n=1 Tax=Vitrella brassicaformis (strain CCMP3155) TaxID=1169540 RepID=A0A0G4EG71_VITBC|nr:unnamed protein product [Vitrella brassicaformis CCMP3155]|eukprot:CEL95516.1 unnamed protein product [Vitrella brassicaformis CCMP3155]